MIIHCIHWFKYTRLDKLPLVSRIHMTIYCKKIEIIPERMKRIIYDMLKLYAFKHNGIIFGGMVRDEIISDYYKKEYYKNLSDDEKVDIKKFWNPAYRPETASRTLNPEDMDISFSNETDSINFLGAVLTKMKNEMGSCMKYTIQELVQSDTQYCMLPLKSVIKVSFDIKLGYIPFIFEGHKIEIGIDIVLPRNKNMLPPFKTLDMLCNSFIMTKHGKMISPHTGTYLDKLSDFERMKASSKIMEDMIHFETNFCLGSGLDNFSTGSFRYNKYAYKRINKLLSKRPNWNIKDLPFEISSIKKGDQKHECCICYTRINRFARKITFYNKKVDDVTGKEKNICSSILHEKCLMNYIEHQIQDYECGSSDDNEFVFKCPFRNPINFLQTSKIVKSKIEEICK